jgi:hypothetical protein
MWILIREPYITIIIGKNRAGKDGDFIIGMSLKIWVGIDQAQTPFLFDVPAGQDVTHASAVLRPDGQERKQIWLL